MRKFGFVLKVGNNSEPHILQNKSADLLIVSPEGVFTQADKKCTAKEAGQAKYMAYPASFFIVLLLFRIPLYL